MLSRMKSLRRVALTAVLIASAFGMSTGVAQAATTLDQSFESYDGTNYVNLVMAQMVTPGITGVLSSVQLNLWNTGTPAAGVTVSIRAASGGLPTGSDLASVLIPNSTIPLVGGWVTAAFTSPPSVTAGTQFAIVFSSTSTNPDYAWSASNTTSYPGGRAATNVTGTWGYALGMRAALFRTYVTTQDAQWTAIPQGLPLSATGTCDALDDKAVAYGTGLTGGWKRSWEPWVNTTIGANGQRIGGWACTRTLINKGGLTWTIAN